MKKFFRFLIWMIFASFCGSMGLFFYASQTEAFWLDAIGGPQGWAIFGAFIGLVLYILASLLVVIFRSIKKKWNTKLI